MTPSDTTPEPAPAETPTAPLPAPEATTPAAAPAAPAGHPHHWHDAPTSAVAAMIVGSLLFAMLAFGAGFAARGAVDRHIGRGGAGFERGYGRGFGQGQGWDQGRGMMRGQGGQGDGWNGMPRDLKGRGRRFIIPNDGSVPSTTTP